MHKLYFLLLCLLVQISLKAQYSVSGTIKNSGGQAIPGVVVKLDGSFIATTSDPAGFYRIEKIKDPELALEFRMLGYSVQVVRLDLRQTKSFDCILKEQPFLADEVVIMGTRADERSGMTYTNISKNDIAHENFGADMPSLLNTLPSVISTSDAGTGIGYTGIRVRGSDATRTNVTINGIPYNDAESHSVYWVNLPDIASSAKSIQVQRGLGGSTNGAGAFGASVNIQTNELRGEPYANYTFSGGSFNTLRHTFEAGTGLVRGFTFDFRGSKITSDGFVDRANADLQSWFSSAAWYRKNTSLRLNIFSGKEKTYQAWYGVPQDSLASNRRYNPAGSYWDSQGKEHFYENETDNYAQTHYQLFVNQEFSRKVILSLAFHYTKGAGYYEQYRQQDKLSKYGIDNFIQTFTSGSDTLLSDTITKSDLIRQRWLDNHFYGTVFSLTFQPDVHSKIIFGGGLNQYRGKHFGEIIWAQWGNVIPYGYRYYDNDAVKTDFNIYMKGNRQFGRKITATIDLQYRTVRYSFWGFNNKLENTQQDVQLHFFNPKIALYYQLNTLSNLFMSLSTGHREPVRDDYTQSSPTSRPSAEKLYDFELGYRLGKRKVEFGATAYYMRYFNQLVLTGAINDVGEYTRTNIPNSYRGGIELEATWKPIKSLRLSGNFAFSSNKISSDFKEVLFDYQSMSEKTFVYQKADIAFSPNMISAGTISYFLGKWSDISLTGKFVGKQYLDNTSSELRKLDPYTVFSLRYTVRPSIDLKPGTEISLMINNLLNVKYNSNGYTYADLYGNQRNDYNFYFPQAGIQVMAMVKILID